MTVARARLGGGGKEGRRDRDARLRDGGDRARAAAGGRDRDRGRLAALPRHPAARARTAEAAGLPVVEAPERLAPALSELRDYFAGDLKEFGVAIDWRLTSDARRRVLTTLYESVPYGQVVTYGELGDRSGTGLHAQVVGQVMGSNPVPLIVPCHRVVAS